MAKDLHSLLWKTGTYTLALTNKYLLYFGRNICMSQGFCQNVNLANGQGWTHCQSIWSDEGGVGLQVEIFADTKPIFLKIFAFFLQSQYFGAMFLTIFAKMPISPFFHSQLSRHVPHRLRGGGGG